MEKLESKTLELSRPATTRSIVPIHSPTTDSSSQRQIDIPVNISLIPNATFKSTKLKVQIAENNSIVLSPVINEGVLLSILARLRILPEKLIMFLNLGHEKLISRLGTHPDLVDKFNLITDPDNRTAFMIKHLGDIPPTGGQRVRSYEN
ncbi:unnamed protein product [Arctia plantaginis]|uniref:Uncharacterized protein n=1 Tax=Arctia plantaginis TaxID=874455 RepID=A0A8S1AJ30_ARCPL|nr:unnamed protein product [Arctia plantaginis]